MANILVFMETYQGRIIPTSLRALEVGRQLASHLGATLYSILSTKEITDSNQDLLYQISAYKTDRLIVASSPLYSGPSRINTDGVVLANIAKRYPPNIFLFGDSPAAVELAAFVSASIKALFARDYTFTYEEEIELSLIDPMTGRALILDEEELEQPVVGIVRGEPHTVPHDFSDLEVIAFKNDFSSYQMNYYCVEAEFQYGEGLLLIAGEHAAGHMEKLKNLSRLKEWTLLGTQRLFRARAHAGVTLFNSRGTKAGRTRLIFLGLSQEDLREVTRFASYQDRCLLVECDAPLPHRYVNQAVCTDSIETMVETLEASIY